MELVVGITENLIWSILCIAFDLSVFQTRSGNSLYKKEKKNDTWNKITDPQAVLQAI
jgi:hypothetical protein